MKPEAQVAGDLLGPLLEIERQAAGLEREAEAIAEGRRMDARREADEQASALVDARRQQLEAELGARALALRADHDAAMRDFAGKLDATRIDRAALAALLERIAGG